MPTPSVDSSASPSTSPAAAAETPIKSDAPLSALGDSVLLGARGAVEDAIPGATIDASVSRYPGAFIGRVKKLSRAGALSDTVLLHMGTNGVMPESMLRDLLDQLTDYNRVILMTSSMPRSWEKPNNKVISKVAPDYPNVVIADWKAESADHPEYFVSDKVHLSAKGAKAYAELVKTLMKP
jgi:lysophospholipase L1-like esterase